MCHTKTYWTQLFAFGDSYSDSGAGYVDGDGPTAIVYAAQELGIPFTFATDPNAGDKGLNYAVSGARTGEGEKRRIKDAVLEYGMQNQVSDFTVTSIYLNVQHRTFNIEHRRERESTLRR